MRHCLGPSLPRGTPRPTRYTGIRERSRHVRGPACAPPVCRAQGFAPPAETGSVKKQAQLEQEQVQDKLIAAFQSKPRHDWRKLMTFSKKWGALADGVFQRVEVRLEGEADAERKLKLRRFVRGLKAAHDDVTRWRALVEQFRTSAEDEHDSIVAGNRDAFTAPFYEFLQHLVAAAGEDKEEQAALIALGARIGALHAAFERAAADDDALEIASGKLQKLLQVESMQEAEQEIDRMAASGELDPALLLTMAKAYSGVKESPYTKEEVKDVMYHLYTKAKETAARQAPKEVRILKHLLSIDDPRQRRDELEHAFQPGAEVETGAADFLVTKPKLLLTTIDTVLQVYDAQRGKTSMVGQAAEMMQPDVIARLRLIRADLNAHL